MGSEKTAECGGPTRVTCVQRLFGAHPILNRCIPTVGFDAERVFLSVFVPERLLIVVLVVMLSAANSASAGEDLDEVDVTLEPDNKAIVDVGRGVYQSHCASCHGKQMEGQPEWRKRFDNGMLPAPPHDKTGHTWHHADDLLFEITKYGVAKVISDPEYLTMMPVFESVLEDKDIIAVLSYIKSTWPAEEREWQEQINNTRKNGFTEVKKKSWLEKWLNR